MPDDLPLEIATSIADGEHVDLDSLRESRPEVEGRLLEAFGVLQRIRLPSAIDDKANTLFGGRYRLEKEIGSGGMGRVYRAYDQTLRRRVALKLMRKRVGREPGSRERFLREARAAAALEHPAIAPIYDAGESDDGTRYIAMPYYEAESLRELIARGPLPIGRAVTIAAQLADALACAHAHGVVHRDLKPGNVVLAADGGVRLIDFGVAKLEVSTVLTHSGAIMGTPVYMAPEQLIGGKVDARADIWALAVVLFEMLTGRRPFTGDDPQALLYAIAHESAPTLEIEGSAGSELAEIVYHGLEKKPADRLATARKMAVALERARSHFPDADETASMVRTRRRSGTTRRLLYATPFVLALLGALLWPIQQGIVHEIAPRSVVAVLPFDNLTGDSSLDNVGLGLADSLISNLAEEPSISVVSRSRAWQAFRENGSTGLAKAIGSSLLLEGSLHRNGEGLRVEIQAVDAESSRVLWSRPFSGRVENLFELQDAIARGLTTPLSRLSALIGRISLQDVAPAYREYLRGLDSLEGIGSPRDDAVAEQHFQRAVDLHEGVAVFHAALSDAIYRQYLSSRSVDLSKAEAHARAAIDLDPHLIEAQLAFARILRLRGDTPASIAELRRLPLETEKPDEVARELAFGYQYSGHTQAAAEYFEEAVRLAPENWYNWNALGAFQGRQGQLDSAAKSLHRATELAPIGVIWPRLNLGGVLLFKGDPRGAILELEATGATTTDPEVASNLGTAHYFLGDMEQAEFHYRLAVELQPERHILHRNLGDVLVQLGKIEEARTEHRAALDIVERELRDEPDSRTLILVRPLYAAKVGNCDSAARFAGEAVARFSEDRETLREAASSYALCNERRRALETIRKTLELGEDPRVIHQIDELVSLQEDPEFMRLTTN